MTSVRFHGWDEGLRKVALNKLFQRVIGVSLAPAKDYVDQILRGEELIVEVHSRAVAEELVKEAGALGARCEIVENEH